VSPDSITAALATANEWVRQGQAHENRGQPEALTAALLCHDRALAIFRSLPPPLSAPLRHAFCGAWMNRGNVLQKQGSATSLGDAVAAYDAAIALMAALPPPLPPAHGNSLGAAWMNRGHALHQLAGLAPDRPDLPAAIVAAHRAAIATLSALPADDRSVRINHAAAWLNLANALLLPAAADPREAARSARTAITLVAATESTDPVAADVGLKARRALCDAIGQLLVSAGDATGELAEEAADTADSGLTLVRHWEARGVREFRPLALRLYRFGARLCLVHQPHFLAEFLLESLTPDADPALHAFAAEFIPDALAALRATSLVGLTPHHQQRIHEAVRELAAASARLTER